MTALLEDRTMPFQPKLGGNGNHRNGNSDDSGGSGEGSENGRNRTRAILLILVGSAMFLIAKALEPYERRIRESALQGGS